ELVDAVAMRGFDVLLRAAADVLRLGHGTQILVPVILGALLRGRECLLKALHLDELCRRLGQHCRGLGARGLIRVRAGLACVHAKHSPTDNDLKRFSSGRLGPPGETAGVLGLQRREFKAAPSNFAVRSTMGITRSYAMRVGPMTPSTPITESPAA